MRHQDDTAYPTNATRKARRTKPLSDTEVRTAKPREKPWKLSDGRGLYLLITPTGGKLWRFKYAFQGREKLLGLGRYPDVSLSAARDLRDVARKQVASGTDPSRVRQAARDAAATTFEVVAREWFGKRKDGWAESHARTVLSRMEQNLFPFLGKRPISEIMPAEVLGVVRRVEAREAYETAHRVMQIASQVFRYAVTTSEAPSDPTRDLAGALVPVASTPMASIIHPNEGASAETLRQIGALLRVLHGYDGTIIVRVALKLAPLLFVRPGELRHAEWSEIDFEKARWNLPPWKMKGRRAERRALVVPLARQAIDALRQLQPVTGDGKYVFPSARSGGRPMSDNAVLAALRRCGIPKDEMTGHGFRSIARTVLDETLGFRTEIIEMQLGHAVRDANGVAYNRTAFLRDRATMMQAWADYLDGLRADASTGSDRKRATT